MTETEKIQKIDCSIIFHAISPEDVFNACISGIDEVVSAGMIPYAIRMSHEDFHNFNTHHCRALLESDISNMMQTLNKCEKLIADQRMDSGAVVLECLHKKEESEEVKASSDSKDSESKITHSET